MQSKITKLFFLLFLFLYYFHFTPALPRPMGFREQDTFVVDHPRKKKARETAITADDILYAGSQVPEPDSNIDLTNYNILENFPSSSSDAMISAKMKETLNLRTPCSISSPYSNLDYEDFSRITTPIVHVPTGEVKPFIMNTRSPNTNYLKCTHIAHGHKDGVVSIECTDDVLFSGSKDRTVKIWDLNTGQEIRQLISHSNTVIKVRYCEYTRLAFTASLSSIKIWDMRQKSACIYTLRSSGIAQKGSSPNDTEFKHVVPPGEYQINDIALNQYGSMLFSTAASYVRVWDLNKFQSICSLNNGFQSTVSCIAVGDSPNALPNENCVINGSTDKSIKVFDVKEGSVGIHHYKCALLPPHYDSIQSLTIHQDTLFSASSDMCIKKWNLETMSVERSLTLGTKKDRLCCVNVIPSGNLFLIGYQSGHLSLWSSDTFESLEVLRAHDPSVNAISSNRSSIFTASDDGIVGIWKLSASAIDNDLQPE